MKLIENLSFFLEGNKKLSFGLFIILLTLLSVYMVFSFFPGSYMFLGHDIDLHMLRLEALAKAFKDGRYPIYLDYDAVRGYGYPTSWFYPDAMLIPFALLVNVSNLVVAYKTLLIVMSVLCGFFMYITLNRIYKTIYISVVGSLLYTFSFYRIQDIFERAALGEIISFTFLPLVFLGLYEIVKGDYKKWYILSIGFTFMMFSHVLSMLLTCFTIVIWLLFNIRPLLEERKRVFYLIISGLVVCVTSSYFTYPLIEQMLSDEYYYNKKPMFYMKTFTLHPIVVLEGFIKINFVPNPDKNIFLASLGLLLGLSVCLRVFIREKTKAIRSVDIGVLIGVFYIIISMNFFPWDKFPFNKFNFIQFPWRLFEFTTYFFSVAGGYYSYKLIKQKKWRLVSVFFLIISTMLIIYNESRVSKNKFLPYNPYNYARTIDNIYSQGTMEYMPAKVPSIDYPEKRRDSVVTKFKETRVVDFKRSKGITSFEVSIGRGEEEIIELPLFYYKGYSAELDGEKIPVKESKLGLLELPQVKHSGEIKVYYSGTLIQKITPYITIISTMLLCIYIFLSCRKKT